MRDMGHQFGETAYIAEVNSARKVEFDGQIAMNKISDPTQKYFSLGWLGGQFPQLKFFQIFEIVRNE